MWVGCLTRWCVSLGGDLRYICSTDIFSLHSITSIDPKSRATPESSHAVIVRLHRSENPGMFPQKKSQREETASRHTSNEGTKESECERDGASHFEVNSK